MDLLRTMRLVEGHEGRVNRLYYDSRGIPTVGVGHNLRDKPLPDAVVDLLYRLDFDEHVDECDKHIPWWRGLDEVRQAALVDLMFNMGWTTLSQFKATLPAFQRKDYEAAAQGLEASLWFKQVGRRGPRVVAMVRTGEWPKDV